MAQKNKTKQIRRESEIDREAKIDGQIGELDKQKEQE